jgi:hypothetical protein
VKEKGKMSIGIAVSFDGSSRYVSKIVAMHTDSSTVVVTELAKVTEAGMNYIQRQGWKKMLNNNGNSETEEQKENGND